MAEQLPIVERLQKELTELKRELKQDIPKALEEARAHGDLKENAEYHAAKERQGMLSARVGQLTARVAELSLYSKASIPRDKAGYGSEVTVEDLDSGEERVYRLVFPEEADPGVGQVSIGSPIGQALLHRREGDEVKVRTPTGLNSLEVTGLKTIHDQ